MVIVYRVLKMQGAGHAHVPGELLLPGKDEGEMPCVRLRFLPPAARCQPYAAYEKREGKPDIRQND